MSNVSNALIEIVEAVVEHFGLNNDDTVFEQVQDIIIENKLPISDKQFVFNFFKDNIVYSKICPKCGCKIKLYYTGRNLCTSLKCDYEGPGITCQN